MNKLGIVLSVVVLVLGGLAAYPIALASGEVESCPGKIECPLTGELVCKDECPLTEGTPKCCTGAAEERH